MIGFGTKSGEFGVGDAFIRSRIRLKGRVSHKNLLPFFSPLESCKGFCGSVSISTQPQVLVSHWGIPSAMGTTVIRFPVEPLHRRNVKHAVSVAHCWPTAQ